jgi:hypothetical protein
MLGRLLERSKQVLELFRELRRPSPPIMFVAPPRVIAKPQHLHITDVQLGGRGSLS